jgi:Uncharacterized conserved protein
VGGAGGTPSWRLGLSFEVVVRVRSSDTDVVLFLSSGLGGGLVIGPGPDPLGFGPMTVLAYVMGSIAHAEPFLPEICSLDCGTFDFGDSSVIAVYTPDGLRAAAIRFKEI